MFESLDGHHKPRKTFCMTLFRIYWTSPDGAAHGEDCQDLVQALAIAEARRKEGMRFVTMASESSQSVGAPGVAAVQDGKLPDGSAYDWSKAGRAGKSRPGDRPLAVRGAQ